MRADVRSLFLEPDPRTLSEDPAEFAFLVSLSVGPSDGPGEETFGVQVCTPEWLVRRCNEEAFVDVRHTIVTTIAGYSEAGLRSYLTRRVEQATGETWHEVAEKVARLGYWEFEDYRDCSR
jgi:hypothetical protein